MDAISICFIESCDRPGKNDLGPTMCGLHLGVLRRGNLRKVSGEDKKPITKEPRKVDVCENRSRGTRGICKTHQDRLRAHGTFEGRKPKHNIDKDGYRRIRNPNYGSGDLRYYIFEHRHVIEQELGRPLRPDETVHHKNGVRHDNRRENLELWTNDHGRGQRVADILAFAHEIVDRYGDRRPGGVSTHRLARPYFDDSGNQVVSTPLIGRDVKTLI